MSRQSAGAAAPLAWRWIALEAALLFAYCACVFYWSLAAAEGPLEGDTLFHYKLARLVLERGPWVDIDSLPYTVLGTHGTDHHWFFHLVTAPVSLLGNEVKDIHLATALLGAAVPALLLPLLRRNGVPWAPIVCLLMVVASGIMPYRLLLLRGQNFAVLMTVAMMFAMLGKHRWWAGIGAFVFMQGYHAAVILALFAVLVGAVQHVEDGRPDWKTLAAVIYGAALGLALSPWFPDNVRFLAFHTLFKVAQAEQGAGLVGSEWYVLSWRHVLAEAWPAHLVFFGALAIGGLLAWRRRLRWSGAALVCTVATLVFLAMYKGAWRFGEYYVPFAVLSAALIWRDALSLAAGPKRPWAEHAPAVALTLLMAWSLREGLATLHGTIATPLNRFQAMMEHVEKHDSRPMVFNTRWSDYMVLFYHARNANTKFVAGMDGHFLMYGDPERFRLWYSIMRGLAPRSPMLAATIHDRFAARWIVLRRGDIALALALQADRNARLAVEDEVGWLFELKAEGRPWP